jgi:hypothetical protein
VTVFCGALDSGAQGGFVHLEADDLRDTVEVDVA